MDLIDDQPRKHPKPVSFCEDIARPVVPEVSLISMEENDKPLGKKNDSFSGTEFQTYNAWRWKYMSGRNEIGGPENRILSRCTKAENCVLIKDKYSSSETEKRKNELLYGEVGEPRQPLFPTVLPEIPQCNDLIFSNNNSFESDIKKKTEKLSLTLKNTEILEDDNNVLKAYLRKGFDNSNKLYDIISEQNKQIEILQQQIQQVLKLQNAKDNQIEQLLKSQESKENKIEKLLQSAEIKDEEIEKLLKLKQKQEQHLKELIILQEEKEAKNFELLKKLNLLTRKETCSIGTMTNMAQMVDCSTNTTEKYHFENGCRGREKPDENSCLRDVNETDGFPERDKSLSLHSSDLPLIQEQVPTPQSSIHLDIQDFHYSSEESDNESEVISNNCFASKKDSNQLGYTFYNNILCQVKDIIQNSGEKELDSGVASKALTENNFVTKKNSLQSLQTFKVLERENIPPTVASTGIGNLANRFLHEPSNICVKDAYSPSDISLKINSLALKYLKQEQISQYNLQPQIPTSRHPDVTIYNVTNLSFGSTRYGVLPNMSTNIQKDLNFYQNSGSSAQLSRRKKKIMQENMQSQTNVLDINPLN